MFEKVVRKTFKVMIAAMAVLIIGMAVLGSICYTRNGWYPLWKNIFQVLSKDDSRNYIQLRDSFNFMEDGGMSMIPDYILLFGSFFLGVLLNLKDHKIRAIISFICFGIAGGSIMFLRTHPYFTLGGLNVIHLALIAILSGIAVLSLCFLKTSGGNYMLIGIGALLAKHILVPILMLAVFLSLKKIIIAAIVIGIFIAILKMDTSKLTSGSTASRSHVSAFATEGSYTEESSQRSVKDDYANEKKAKDQQKIRDEIRMYEEKIRKCRNGIQAHREGRFGYGHVDEAYTRREIDKYQRNINMLRNRLS